MSKISRHQKARHQKTSPSKAPLAPPKAKQSKQQENREGDSGANGANGARSHGKKGVRYVPSEAAALSDANDLDGSRTGAVGSARAIKPTPLLTRARKWQAEFLRHLANTGIAEVASRAVGIDRSTAFRYKADHPEFAQKWAEAIERSTELLEAALLHRARDGVTEPIWSKDRDGNPVKVDEVRKYSDRSAEFLLISRNRAKYGRQSMELTGANGAPLTPLVAPAQVQIIIPSNGREPQPQVAINVPSQVANEPQKQIESASQPQSEGIAESAPSAERSPSA